MDKEKIVVLDSYSSLIEAEIVKGRLQSNGIDCFLSDTTTALLYPFYAEQFPGVRLNVFEKDLAHAREILSEDVTPETDHED